MKLWSYLVIELLDSCFLNPAPSFDTNYTNYTNLLKLNLILELVL